MEQSNEILGYTLDGEFSSENAGNGSWTSAHRDGKKYFIKKLKETYINIPLTGASAFQKATIEQNQKFETRIKNLYRTIRDSDNGNLVVPVDFLKEKGHYYVITEWVEQMDKFDEIMTFTEYQKHLMMKVLAYSLHGLAENHVVHSDLKPENICIKPTTSGAKTLKIIDFDTSFIEGFYPDMVGGDMGYASPELLIRMHQDEDEEIEAEDKIGVTTKSDVFALGLIFHKIITGKLPEVDGERMPFGMAVGRGIDVLMDPTMPTVYRELIEKMMRLQPEERPSALEVFNHLKNYIDPLNLR